MRQGGQYKNDGKGKENSVKLIHRTKPALPKPAPKQQQQAANAAGVSDDSEN